MFQSKFHIDDDGPDEIYEYLDTIETYNPEDDDGLKQAAQELGHDIGFLERITAGNILLRIGVVDLEDKYQITELGDQLVDVMYTDPELFNNILHFLFYTAYDRYPERYVYSSYTYKSLCNYLYNNGPFSSVNKGDVIGDVSTSVEATQDLDMSRTSSGVSLSTKTFNNFWQYLEKLKPSVITDPDSSKPSYSSRSFCPPGLFILATDYVYKQTRTEHGTLLQSTPEIEAHLKQVCLLSDEGLSEVIDFAETAYPFFSTKHDFGLQLRLNQEVEIADVQ